MGKKKGKRTRKAPPPEKQCKYMITRSRRCKNAKQKGRDYCKAHPPGHNREELTRANQVKSERKRLADECAKRWQIENWGDTMAHLLVDLEAMGKDRTKMPRHRYWSVRAGMWGKFIEAQKAQATFEKGGFRVLLIREGGGDYWGPEPVKPRPEPTEIDVDGGHKFKPPVPKEKTG